MSPGRRLSFPLAVFTLGFALLLTPSLLRADKVYLKNGDVVSGTIIEETPDIVRVQVLVGTIKDKRAINRISIDRIEKTTPEDVEREALLPLKTTPDGLPVKGYEERLKVVNEFLTKYPSSKYLAEIQGIRDSLNGELEKVKAGEVRFRGTWLTPDQQTVHAPNLEAATALRIMRQAAAGRNLLGALRQFEMIEKTYPGTLAYPVAVNEAKSILPAYGQRLTQELEYAKYDAAQNAKGMASLTGAARAAAQQEIDAAAARFKAQVDAEKAKKITWLSVDLKSELSINEAIARVRKEIDRVGKLDLAALDEQAKAFYEAGELIYAGKLDEAKTALTAAAATKGGAKLTQPKSTSSSARKTTTAASTTATPERPSVLAYLQKQLDDRVQKKANEAKLAELEAEKAAGTDANKPGETATASGDDALDALVMQRTASSAATDKPKEEEGAAKGSKPERKTSATRPSAKSSATAAASEDDSGVPARPKPAVVIPKKSSSPLPMIIGGVAVCLVGATVFLFIQEKKKQQGDS